MSAGNKQFDPKNMNHAFVITGLVGMIEEDGLTFREAMDVLESIKRETFPALMQISREKGGKS